MKTREERIDEYRWFWCLLALVFAMALTAIIIGGIAYIRALDSTTNSVCDNLCFGPCIKGIDGRNGTNGTNGISGVIDFASFYALKPNDNFSPIPGGVAIAFPHQGPTHPSSNIYMFFTNVFVITNTGSYEFTYYLSVTEACQIALELNGVVDPNTVSGRATGTNYAYGKLILDITTPFTLISVVNAGLIPLTVTGNAGGTQVSSSYFNIKQLS